MSYDAVRAKLDAGEIVMVDGAMGSELQLRGIKLQTAAWAAMANLEYPGLVVETHSDYIAAGADVIITNTFGASREQMESEDLGERFEEANRRAVELAREARDAANQPERIAIAGSISIVSDQSHPETAFDNYREQAALFKKLGVDLIALEMLQDLPHTQAALRAAQVGLPVWAGFSTKLDDEGRIVLLNTPPQVTFEDALTQFDLLGIDAVTAMHTGLDDVVPALDAIRQHWNGPMGAYPHVGRWLKPDWAFDDSVEPAAICTRADEWVGHGATIIGTCCGLGPEYVRALSGRFKEQPGLLS